MGLYTQGSSIYRRELPEGRTLVIRSRDMASMAHHQARGWAVVKPDCEFVATVLTAQGRVVKVGYGHTTHEAEAVVLAKLEG